MLSSPLLLKLGLETAVLFKESMGAAVENKDKTKCTINRFVEHGCWIIRYLLRKCVLY